jgi:hypothetical protein
MAVLKIVWPLLVCGSGLLGQYTAERTGPVPARLAPGIGQLLEKEGFKISHDGAPYCEIWFRADQPGGRVEAEPNVTLPSIPPGTLEGVIRFDGNGADRRGQRVGAGIYTLRYARMPRNEAHQAVARQRDFLVLAPAASDPDANAIPNFEALMKLSTQASGTSHPAVLSLRRAESDSPGFSQRGDDWVLETKLGQTPIEVILIGSANP